MSVEELRSAVAEDRLVLIPVERALLSPPQYTLAELADLAGVHAEAARLRLRGVGVPIPDDESAVAFGDDELALVKRTNEYLASGLSIEEGQPTMRVLSSAMQRVAEPMRRLYAETYLAPGINERELAKRYGEMAEQLMPLLVADLEYLLRMHLRDQARHDALTAAELASGRLPEAVETTIAFADIVGFTALGEELAEEALTDIAEKLERLSSVHVRRPARMVKTIGDAVMVVGRDPVAVVESMLDLVAAAEAEEEMPPLRAGAAYGRAVPRLGDWFGPTVNLAARLAARARPGTVLVPNGVRDALGDRAEEFSFSEAGLKRLKGISDPVPTLRVRRA